MKTVSVHYLGSQGQYTFMTDDESIVVGDCVVVKTPYYSVAKVDEVHDKPQLKGGYQYTWIVQKIDSTEYDKKIAAERIDAPSVEGRL